MKPGTGSGCPCRAKYPDLSTLGIRFLSLPDQELVERLLVGL